MGEDELKIGLEEVKGILAAVGAHIDFYACDAEVHSAKKIQNVQEAVRLLKGGGGTDMRPAFEMITQSPRKPELIVCITDGQIGDAGPKPSGMHVIWLVCGRYRNNKPAPWGDVIELDPRVPGAKQLEED